MINARNFCESVCSKASQLGFGLAFNKHRHGYSWMWNTGGIFPIVGWADPSDKAAALCMACDDLAKAMGWDYVER